MTHFEIRTATPDDAEEVLRLAYVAWATYPMKVTNTDWHDNYYEAFSRYLKSGQMQCFAIDHPSESKKLIAVGLAFWFELMPAPWLTNGRMGYLQWFSVDEDWRGRGIGKQLLEVAKEWLVEQGCTRIQLHSNPAVVSLYERAGFENTAFPNMWWRSTPPMPLPQNKDQQN